MFKSAGLRYLYKDLIVSATAHGCNDDGEDGD